MCLSLLKSEAQLQEMADIGLILVSDIKYHFRLEISTYNLFPEPNFNQIRLEIKNFEILKDSVA